MIEVGTSSKNYNIIFENDFSSLSKYIHEINDSYSKIIVISDSKVSKIYNDIIAKSLEQMNVPFFFVSFNQGEKNKTVDTVCDIYEALINNNVDRKALVLAVGGGITGDLAGFVAATYMRGIDFVNVPTSLLAQVDSSVGGKTGFDHLNKKNIIGAFYQPNFVYINTKSLKTLDKKHFINGMAEAIKHGLILDRDYFYFIKNNYKEILRLDSDYLEKLIHDSCLIKAKVVSFDERESGYRAILNFGHSVGHAIESMLNYEMLHGECISVGMIFAAYISKQLGHLSEHDYNEIKDTFRIYGLPLSVSGLRSEDIYKELFSDKKTIGNKINIICLKEIGRCYQNYDLTREQIISGLNSIIEQ